MSRCNVLPAALQVCSEGECAQILHAGGRIGQGQKGFCPITKGSGYDGRAMTVMSMVHSGGSYAPHQENRHI